MFRYLFSTNDSRYSHYQLRTFGTYHISCHFRFKAENSWLFELLCYNFLGSGMQQLPQKSICVLYLVIFVSFQIFFFKARLRLLNCGNCFVIMAAAAASEEHLRSFLPISIPTHEGRPTSLPCSQKSFVGQNMLPDKQTTEKPGSLGTKL